MSARSLGVGLLCGLLLSPLLHAQERVYRCPGNEYTNQITEARAKGCKLLDGGNITVIRGGAAPQASANSGGSSNAAPRAAAAPAPSRIATPEQKARDSDAKGIIEAELRKAEARQAALLTEYNNGQPERRGDERNYQKYLDRVTDLRAQIGRNESDIASLKRELGRFGAGGGSAP